MPYERLRDTNVIGCLHILYFVCHLSLKTIHFVSSMSAVPSIRGKAPFSELTCLATFLPLHQNATCGYGPSKFVAEMWMQQARQRGLEIVCYRPGHVGFHSVSGVFNPNDFHHRLFWSIIKSRSFPETDAFTKLASVPVDFG